MGSGTAAKRTLTRVERPGERPPSVDALARSIAGSTPPDPRRHRPCRDRRRRSRLGAHLRRRAFSAHTALAGRQRHGRALAHQPGAGTACSRPPRPPADDRVRPRHRRARVAPARSASCSPSCAAPRTRSSSTTTRRPCCSSWQRSPPAGTSPSREASRSRSAAPSAPRSARAVRRPARRRGDHEPHPPRRLPAGDRAGLGNDIAVVLKVHPSNPPVPTASSRARRSPSWQGSASRSSPTSAVG